MFRSALGVLATGHSSPRMHGMFRLDNNRSSPAISSPRMHGDVPMENTFTKNFEQFSPYPRGCSDMVGGSAAYGREFPAHAGMFRFSNERLREVWCCSLHTQGCSGAKRRSGLRKNLFPVHAGAAQWTSIDICRTFVSVLGLCGLRLLLKS
jgi:hypothetical protein